ncbi:MAG: AarF/UbiB family protein [Planctomycetota bacterium]
MKLSSIPAFYRNLRRGREILRVLQRYGLADWLSRSPRLGLSRLMKDRTGVPLSEYTRPQRIRMALTELGPTFIKFGQVIAARPDLIGNELAEELKGLRGRVTADKIETVRQTLAHELGDNYQRHFDFIEPEPLATASIGQVHRARLVDGRDVVIKVQRDGIDRVIHEDLEVLIGLAQIAEKVDTLAVWAPTEMVRQLKPMILAELDFNRERTNLKQFAEVLSDRSDRILVPRVEDRLCTRRVLVMDELVGRPLSTLVSKRGSTNGLPETQAPSLSSVTEDKRTNPSIAPEDSASAAVPDEPDLDLGKVGETLADAYLRMVFDGGFFHADPHMGNLLVLDDGRLGILDFGMVGRIDENLRETIEEMLIAIGSGDRRRLTRLIRQVGTPRREPWESEVDRAALEVDVAEFVDLYGRQTLDRFDLAGALNELTDILHRHGIGLPSQSSLLLKMLVSLEGTLRELGVGFDSLEVVRSHVRRIALRRLSPQRRLRQARRIYLENEAFLETAPDQVLSVLDQLRRGEVRLRLEPLRFAPVVNRLVVGVMASAVFLGSSLLLSYEVAPVLFPEEPVWGIHRLSILGLLGFVSSFAVMMVLTLSMLRRQ